MYGYTPNIGAAQAGAPSTDDVEDLSEADILPDDFQLLAPDDQTVEVACLFARRNPLAPGESATMTAILLAWEQGDISGFEALDCMDANECAPYDEILGVYLAFVRARAAADVGRAA